MEERTGADGGHLLDRVFEFADVAGPFIAEHGVHGFLGERMAGAVLGQKVPHKERDVFFALAERGDTDGDDVETVIEIAAERPLLHFLQKIAVGGGDDPEIGALHLQRADGTKLFFLKYAEKFGLEV